MARERILRTGFVKVCVIYAYSPFFFSHHNNIRVQFRVLNIPNESNLEEAFHSISEQISHVFVALVLPLGQLLIGGMQLLDIFIACLCDHAKASYFLLSRKIICLFHLSQFALFFFKAKGSRDIVSSSSMTSSL